MTEFNLSEKKAKVGTNGNIYPFPVYHEKDVKEFIRLLKEEVDGLRGTWKRATILKLIDRLAGDKL